MAEKNKIPDLTRSLFWDVDYNKIDFREHAPFIVERVLGFGQIEDFKTILHHYGKENLHQITLKLRYLDNKTLAFCSAFFNEPIQNFRCYILKQSNQPHWNY